MFPTYVVFKKNDNGQVLFNRVCDDLGGIVERDYFGLRYMDKHNQRVRMVYCVIIFVLAMVGPRKECEEANDRSTLDSSQLSCKALSREPYRGLPPRNFPVRFCLLS